MTDQERGDLAGIGGPQSRVAELPGFDQAKDTDPETASATQQFLMELPEEAPPEYINGSS